MRRLRNEDEFEFYVVQFLDLPFEGIDDYVCVPNTWMISKRTVNNRAAVAYPEEKIALIEERVKRKEGYCNNWRFYSAVIKYQSNIYEIAEQWIIESRRNQRPFIERNADNLEVRETRRIPDMQPASSLRSRSRTKRPGPPELYKQLDTKHLKLNKDAQSPSPGQISQPRPSQPNQQDSQRQLNIPKIRAHVANELLNSRKMSTLQGLLKSIRHTLSATDRAPMERTNDSTCVSFASRSADSPTAPQNTTSIKPTIQHVRFKLEQQMLDNFSILSTQMGSVLINTIYMYENLRSSILETAQIYKKLLRAVELFNSIQNSTGNETFRINLRPEVRKSPEEIRTEVTASTSSSSQDRHSKHDANKPPENKHESWRFGLPPEYDRHDTRWTLKYRRNLPGLVELIPQSGVFISYRVLKYCQHVSKDCKSLARRLLSAVFSIKALSVCSTMTEKAQAPVGTDARPELDNHACEVLLNYVFDYGLQQGWNRDLSSILSSIDETICKIRIYHRIVVER
ncbi:uncharacterized protein LOC123697524 [Colias croceus]|uniref:uncharacterized protein LOC123697524 n=1 Tax=Colias crocea TaxID=72248 RepID=UPI001E27CAB6|nr:uncharacterized protein LOC123697524 [Colias croceus]